MTIEQILNQFLADAQSRVAEMGYELHKMEKLRKVGTPEFNIKQDKMYLLIHMLDFVYDKWYILYDKTTNERAYRIVDWTDAQIIKYIEYLNDECDLVKSSMPVELGYVPPAAIRYSITVPGSLNNIPLGTPGYKAVAGSSGQLTWIPDSVDTVDSFDDF